MKKIIIDIPGGFGNQLFGYALGYAIAKETNYKLYIHTPFQDNGITWNLQLEFLNLEFGRKITYRWTKGFLDRLLGNRIRRRINIGFSTKILRENLLDPTRIWNLNNYCELVKKYDSVMLFGNWENERFFRKYRDDIIRMTEPKIKRTEMVEQLVKRLKNDRFSVGVHIRRGDKADMGNALSAEYYNHALNQMYHTLYQRSKYRDGQNLGEPIKAEFWVISDDIKWCKDNLKLDDEDGETILRYPEYSSDNPTLDDWLILKACNHHVIGNSTFSWWAAWLSTNAEQIVVCPKGMAYKLDDWIEV